MDLRRAVVEEEMKFQYKDYVVVVNRVPEPQPNFPAFGWAFQVRKPDTNELVFRVVIKSREGERSENNLNRVRELGLQFVHSIIDKGNDKSEYCFWWEEGTGLKDDDCENVSPPPFRSPWR
jgi:hypothetical protein